MIGFIIIASLKIKNAIVTLTNPVQTYFVPLPEDSLFATFDTILICRW